MLDESDIVNGIKDKNQEIFRLFVEAWQQKIINTCLGFTNNFEDAQDLAQEVFIEVYNSIEKFRGDSMLSTWIYRITVNKSINYIKKRKRNKFISLFFNESDSNSNIVDSFENWENNVDDYMVQNERRKILHKALQSLPEKQRIAFTLHKIEDVSYKNIAEIMELSITSVESLIHRAKINLQKKLLKYYKEIL